MNIRIKAITPDEKQYDVIVINETREVVLRELREIMPIAADSEAVLEQLIIDLGFETDASAFVDDVIEIIINLNQDLW